MIRLELPYPPKQLFPNYKRAHHWTKYHKQARAARTLGWGLAAQALGPRLRDWPQQEVEIILEITPPKRPGRPADEDGIKGACKHYFDGLSDALGVDDAKFRVGKPVWHDKDGNGQIVISFQ